MLTDQFKLSVTAKES